MGTIQEARHPPSSLLASVWFNSSAIFSPLNTVISDPWIHGTSYSDCTSFKQSGGVNVEVDDWYEYLAAARSNLVAPDRNINEEVGE
jgi:hypothetical protein